MKKYIPRIFNIAVISTLAVSPLLWKGNWLNSWGILLLFLCLIFICMKPGCYMDILHSRRLRTCQNGVELIYLFLSSCVLAGGFWLATFAGWTLPQVKAEADWRLWLGAAAVLILVEAVVFWSGILRIYLSSAQIGIKWRLIGIVCGMIPVVHLIVLGRLVKLAAREVQFENEKIVLDENRAADQVCATKYPILMVHGVFFRDFRYLNYWGRIPAELEKNGVNIYYGNHQSAASVADSGAEIAARIKAVLQETGSEKVNIIAHSKGGLDSRYAISRLGMAPYVASLTTINTPHRGCEFADYLLNLIPKKQKNAVAAAYNATLKKLGDDNPDFLAAVGDLTASACRKLNEELQDPAGVYIQSTGSCLKHASGGRFPLNLTNRFVHLFDGENDGLVGEASFRWGEAYTYLTAPGHRGISHGDMIDLNRENIEGFDVREFYVNLVKGLKEKGF